MTTMYHTPDALHGGARIALLAMAALLTACEQKDLCYDHDAHAGIAYVEVDASYEKEWEYPVARAIPWISYGGWGEEFGIDYDDLRPDTPEGLRSQIFRDDESVAQVNLPPEGGLIPFRDTGEYSLLFYNNDTEYVVFDAATSALTSRATTRSRSRSTFLGSTATGSTGENTVNPPDMLYGCYVPSYVAERSDTLAVLPVLLQPLVYTYLVRYWIDHGRDNVSLARGALSGMAASVWLTTGQTSTETATLLYDCDLTDFGAQAIVRSFGVSDSPECYYRANADQQYFLNLEVRLRNGRILNFDYDVTEQVARQPRGGIIEVELVDIPDDDASTGGSAFDVTVDDWGEYEDVYLPL
jgi:hypothetical protein